MRRRLVSAVGRISDGSASALFVCFAAFLIGCAAGTAFSGMVPPDGALADYFSHFFELYLSGDAGTASAASVFFNTYVYHFLVFLCGFSVIGPVLIPLTAAARGFLLAFSVAAIIRLYSGGGVSLALTAFGVTSAVSVPCFLIVSVLAFGASRRLFSSALSRGGSSKQPYPARYYIMCGVCFSLLLLPALCELFILPKLLRAAILRI